MLADIKDMYKIFYPITILICLFLVYFAFGKNIKSYIHKPKPIENKSTIKIIPRRCFLLAPKAKLYFIQDGKLYESPDIVRRSPYSYAEVEVIKNMDENYVLIQIRYDHYYIVRKQDLIDFSKKDRD